MSWRVSRLNSEIKKIDSRLFVFKAQNGPLQILRKPDKALSNLYDHTEESSPAAHSHFVIALTDTWKANGRPVERGIEQVLEMLRAMDSWNEGDSFEAMKKRREAREEDKKRALKNDLRARAADLRKDFAKATNDINTSGLGRVGD